MFLKKSDKLAIVDFDGTHITFNDFVGYVKYISRNTINDITKEKHVLIVAENRKEWIFSFFAIWDRGAIPVALDFMSNEKELQYFINDCDPDAIIVTNTTIDTVINATKDLGKNLKIYNLDEVNLEIIDDDVELKTPLGDDVAVMIYTSGTTGNAKGIMLTYNNLIGEIKAIQGFNIVKEDEQIISILPYHHILPLMGTCLYEYYYENMKSVVLVEKLTSQEILKKFAENRITMFVGVPRVFKLFYKSVNDKIQASFIAKLMFKIAKRVRNKKFSRFIFKKVHDTFGGHLRTIIAGGAKSDPEMIEFFEILGFSYCEGYGLSETAPVIAGSVYPNYRIGTVGKTVVNAQIKLIDGELCVKGPMVMKSYYNKPEKTKEVFTEDGWFRTGDLASISDDGYITIIGRANAMIVLSNGKNIDPEKIEMRITKLSGDLIEEIGIFGKNDKLCALIVPKANVANITTFIRDIIQIYNKDAHNYEKILDYKLIEQELPKTRVGKLRRFMLPELYEGRKEKIKIENEPDTLEYKVMKEYITKLKGTQVGPDENFEIEIGLDSLDQMEMLSYIENSFGVKMDEEILSKHHNLRLLSKYIQEYSTKFSEQAINLSGIITKAPIKKLHESIAPIFVKPFLWLLFKIYFRLSVKGTDKILDVPTIFIANHESFVDAPILINAIPNHILKKTYFYALEKYFNSSFMKFVGKHTNVITVNIDKDIKNSIEQMANVLKQNKNIFIFPEGSRTKDGKIAEFKKVFAIIAKELNVNIQCIGIDGAYEAYSRFDKFPRPKKISVEVLDSVDTEGKTYEQIVNECVDVFKKFKEKKGK